MINKLTKNEIFVFGSNLNGSHGGGAALQAKNDFGAEEGIGEGLTGQCYAFPTLNKKMRKVSKKALIKSRKKLYECALENPKKKFLLTKVGCGIAGFDEDFMKSIMCLCDIPNNVVLPEGWYPRRWKFVNLEGNRMIASQNDFEWKVGEWFHQKGNIKLCENGFHCSVNPLDSLNYVKGERILLVECKGDSDTSSDKECWSDMIAVKAYEWDKIKSVKLSIFAAEKVVDIYEKEYPKDYRPRKAIEAAKKYLENPSAYAAARAAYAASSAYAAASSAYAAARAAYAASSAYAAAYAASSAYAAAYAASSAARAAYAASSASAAASAADDDDDDEKELLLEQINEYMTELTLGKGGE